MDVLVVSRAVEAIICELDVTYSLSGTSIYLFCLLLITLRCVSERPARHPASRRFPTLAACLGFLPGLGQEMHWLQCTQLPALLSSVSTARPFSLATNTEVITDFSFGVADLLGINSKLLVTESTTLFASVCGQITISSSSPNSVSLRPKCTTKILADNQLLSCDLRLLQIMFQLICVLKLQW